jgi:dTDP-4-dehydrorhamnose reductase
MPVIGDDKLLVIGGSGELGRQLIAVGSGRAVHATYLSRPQPVSQESWYRLDITNGESVHHLMRQIRPDVVIHAAHSGHDRARYSSDVDFQTAIVEGGRHVAEAAAEVGARCVMMSTDLVFDGTRGSYSEEDPARPIMPYGQAKADMEGVVLAMGTDLAIVRTSLILTLEPMGKHVSWIVNALQRGERRDLFTDELRCPIWSDELAAALLELASLDYRGLLHIAGPEVNHRYALGLAMADQFNLDSSLIVPALSAESGLERPLDCTLDCSRAYSLLKTPVHGVGARFGKAWSTL